MLLNLMSKAFDGAAVLIAMILIPQNKNQPEYTFWGWAATKISKLLNNKLPLMFPLYSDGSIPKISIPIRSRALNIDPGPIPSLGPSLWFNPGPIPIRSSIPTHAQAFIQIFMLWFYTYHSVLHRRILPFST